LSRSASAMPRRRSSARRRSGRLPRRPRTCAMDTCGAVETPPLPRSRTAASAPAGDRPSSFAEPTTTPAPCSALARLRSSRGEVVRPDLGERFIAHIPTASRQSRRAGLARRASWPTTAFAGDGLAQKQPVVMSAVGKYALSDSAWAGDTFVDEWEGVRTLRTCLAGGRRSLPRSVSKGSVKVEAAWVVASSRAEDRGAGDLGRVLGSRCPQLDVGLLAIRRLLRRVGLGVCVADACDPSGSAG
jgi:hypothetical protein